jgi:hypothetical protein
MNWNYDKETLTFKRSNKFILYMILTIFLTSFLSFLIGVKSADRFEKNLNDIVYYNPPTDPHILYIDSLFDDYEKRANVYLKQKRFKDTPIKGSILSIAAKDAYLSTGVYVPVELVLAQALIESDMGTKGRSAKNNPFNIGEYDTYTAIRFNTTYEGVKAYYHYMTSSYLKCKPIDLLFKNFTNCKGLRYATSPNYEKEISKSYFKIKEYIDSNI